MGINQRNFYARQKAEAVISKLNGFPDVRYVGAFGGIDGVEFNALFIWNRFLKYQEVNALYLPFYMKIKERSIDISLTPGSKC